MTSFRCFQKKKAFKDHLKMQYFRWLCSRAIEQIKKPIVLMLHEHERRAQEEISSESLVQGLSQCYGAHSSDGWKALNEL